MPAIYGMLTKNINNMDVISEIKKFEQFPDRPNFSDLQVNDFYKKLVDHPLTFEAMVTSVKRGSRADYEIQADTYKYSVIHNPVSGRDFVSWAPDISFVCECKEDVLKFNPITDLIKGDRFHSSATFIGKEDKEIRVKLTSVKKLIDTQSRVILNEPSSKALRFQFQRSKCLRPTKTISETNI